MNAPTATARVIGITHFNEVRIDEIVSGRVPMEADERAFLVADTARFEECACSQEELCSMNDADLMNAAYGVWADYASGQI